MAASNRLLSFGSDRLLIPQDRAAFATNNFDALRLFLALIVVWSHSFAFWYGTEDVEPLTWLLRGAYKAGDTAVLGFFSISGFLITASFERSRSAGRFLGRRVRRIYPGYLVAVLICSLILIPAFSARTFGDISAGEWRGLFSNALLRNYLIASDPPDLIINGSLWSIPFEFWCYLGVLGAGLLGWLGRRRGWWWLPLLLMVAARFASDVTGRRPGMFTFSMIFGWPYIWTMVGPSFVLGMLTYFYRDSIPRSRIILIALLAAVVVAARLLPIAYPRLLMPAAFNYLIFYLAFSRRVRLHGAARFGDFSYGAYLYAFPLQQILAFSLRPSLNFTTYLLLCLGSALLAGVLSWHGVERWFLETSDRKKRRAAVEREHQAVVEGKSNEQVQAIIEGALDRKSPN